MSDHHQWLVEWLQELNLSEYLTNFEAAELTTREQIAAVEQPVLEIIGITKIGHINRLQKATESLRGQLVSMAQDTDASSLNDCRSNPQIVLDESERPIPTGHASPSNLPDDALQAPPIPVRRSFKRRSPSPSSDEKLQKTECRSSSVSPVPVPVPRNKITPPTVAPRVHSLKRSQDIPSSGSLKEGLPASSTMKEVSPLHLPLGKSESVPVQALLDQHKAFSTEVAKRTVPSPKPRRRPSPRTLSPSRVPTSPEQVASSSPRRTTKYYENVGMHHSLNRSQSSSSSQAVADSHIPENQSVLPNDLPVDGAVSAVVAIPLTASTTQMHVQKIGSAPPPPPVRTSSKKGNQSKPGGESARDVEEMDSTSIQVSTTDHLLKELPEEDRSLPPVTPPSLPSLVPLADDCSAEAPPGLPPKDVSLSDLPEPVMPRISSLGVLLSREVSGEDMLPSAVDESAMTEGPPNVLVSPERDTAYPVLETVALDIFTPLPTLPPMEESISLPVPIETAIARMPQDCLLEDVPGDFPPALPPRAPRLSVPDFTAPFPPLADDGDNNDILPSAIAPSLSSFPPSQSAYPCGDPPLEDSSQPSASTFLPPSQPPAISSVMPPVPEDVFVPNADSGETIMTSPQHGQAPPLPPKDVPNLPPPPPPITDEDFPTDSSSDFESSTEEGEKMVIVSSITRQSTVGIIPLTVKHSPMSDELDDTVSTPLSPTSSVCSDTEKGLVTIVQQSSQQHDDIIDMEVLGKKIRLICC